MRRKKADDGPSELQRLQLHIKCKPKISVYLHKIITGKEVKMNGQIS